MKKIISTPNAPAAIGAYSQAVETNGTLYLSGQVPIDPSVGSITTTDIREQTQQVMKNIGSILQAAGYTYADVVKSTIFLTDINHFSAVNDIYQQYYPQNPPARSAIAVKALPLDALVEIETVAVLSK